jgi:3-oxoadipate enol-lactonase
MHAMTSGARAAAASVVVVGGRSLHVVVEGAGPPLLLISGLGFDHRAWDMQVPALCRAGVACVRYDQRDVGRSERQPAGSRYTPVDLAADALGLMDVLGHERFHVAGVSLGGTVAQELALRAPARVRSLSLIVSWARSGRRWSASLAGWRALLPRLTERERWERVMVDLFSDELLDDAERHEALLQRLLAQPDPQEPDAFLRQLACAAAHDAERRLPLLARSMPVHVIAAGADALIPRPAAERLRDALPGCRYSLLEGAPHGVNLEGASRLNPLLLAALRDGA